MKRYAWLYRDINHKAFFSAIANESKNCLCINLTMHVNHAAKGLLAYPDVMEHKTRFTDSR